MTQTATPMLQQYQQIKARHQDCILFFRLGDFYEMFNEDAQTASRILDLVLTARGKGTAHQMPMCGIPYHAAEGYIARLIKAGQKVAICEQVEDPSQAKGLVQRDVIRVITAGTYLDEASHDARYLLCVCPGPRANDPIGIAFIDPSQGAIQTNQYPGVDRVVELISRLPVCECVFPEGARGQVQQILDHPLFKARGITLSPYEDWCFNPDLARKNLCDHFGVHNLSGFGIAELSAATASTGALLEYLKRMNKQPLQHIDRVALYADAEYAYISPAATYGLELDTLFGAINHTLCAAGRRRLKYWLTHPLRQPAAILQRQTAVTLLKGEPDALKALRACLSRFPDLEKSVSKLSCGYSQARDLLGIRNALCLWPDLQAALKDLTAKNALFTVDDIPDLRALLERAINPDMPLAKNEGKVINKGFDPELDELRDIQETGRQWLRDFQEREIRRTGINSLKVGFNKVFGYYIELTRANTHLAPDDYIRKQTLVNGERFITPELKDYEEKILTAQDRVIRIEARIIKELTERILAASPALHDYAHAVAVIDGIASLAVLAQRPGYIAPHINEETVIDIKDGRHPVVEQTTAENFVPNDTYLDADENHLLILTGPNMAGKSTYIRQIAILVIMAQMGSYLPAAGAVIGVVDKIFTRIGAHDDISKGQSTFMVEMTEAADILNNLTERSLVILDEIGRGTSTYDGLSLAWALAEHLRQTRARTLFATHFHELTVLADEHSGVKNYNVAVKEWKDEIIFLHKIVPGSTDDSYGIYVAKLAGVPKTIIRRAKQVLSQLEMQANLKETLTGPAQPDAQLSLFNNGPAPDPAAQEIRDRLQAIDINQLTPLAALQTLQELQELLGRE